MPAFSLDWNPPTRLTVQSCIYAVRWLTGLSRARARARLGANAACCNWRGTRRTSSVSAGSSRPSRFRMKWRGWSVASRAPLLRALRSPAPGWWLPAAGWADPASVCRANLAAAGAAVRCLFNSEAAQLRRAGDELGGAGCRRAMPLARAPVVILANAGDARSLPGFERLAAGADARAGQPRPGATRRSLAGAGLSRRLSSRLQRRDSTASARATTPTATTRGRE